MAIQKITKDGYGQIELNQVAWPRDGRIEAQCGLDETDFASMPAENGMLLSVDRAARRIKLYDPELPLAVNYTTEHMYDERDLFSLRKFKLNLGEFFPRVGYPSIGDKWTSNTVCYETTEFTDDDALKAATKEFATTPVYAVPEATTGYFQLTASKPASGFYAQVVEDTTMPDGQWAVMLQCFRV